MKKILALALSLTLALSLCACGGDTTGDTAENTDAQQMETDVVEIPEVEDLTSTDTSTIPGVEDGVLTVGMECAYAPYNWTQNDDSNGAVPIVNNPGSYANGYDVMIAQRICDTYGWELEIMSLDWAGLIPALQAGTIDAVIAGQSMTEDRMAEVDMSGFCTLTESASGSLFLVMSNGAKLVYKNSPVFFINSIRNSSVIRYIDESNQQDDGIRRTL